MEIFKTKLDSAPEMIFDISVRGTVEPITEVRLCIHNEKQKISYLGSYRNEKAIFRLDNLEEYFSSGVFEYDLEIFIGNQYFVPLSGQIELTEPTIVEAVSESITETKLIEASLNVQKSEINKVQPTPKFKKNKSTIKIAHYIKMKG